MNIFVKIMFILLTLSLIPLMIIEGIHSRFSEDLIKLQTINHLESLAESIERQIESEIEKFELVADLFSSRLLIRQEIDQFNIDQNQESKKTIDKIILGTLFSVPSLDAIHIVGLDGKIISSTNKLMENKSIILEDFSPDSKSQTLTFFKKPLENNQLHVFLSSPMYFEERFIGTSVLIFDPNDIFLPTKYVGLGDTGEYVIAKRDSNGDALFVMPLRFDSDATLSLKIEKERSEIPIIQALNGIEKTFDDKIDYRGEKVFSVTKYVESADWGIVVKIDQTEALQHLKSIQMIDLFSIFLVVITVMILSFFVAKYISIKIRKIKNATTEISRGNLEYVIDEGGTDEFSDLSKNINKMTKDIDLSIKGLKDFKYALDESSIVAITDSHGIITYVNSHFCEISKYSKEELIGQNHRILKSGYHDESFFKGMWNTISSGKIWKGIIKNKAKDGSFYWLYSTIVPFFDDEGKIKEYLAIRTDITEQKELTEKLVRSERMSSIGHLASRMAHDIRNPLSIIQMSIDNLTMMYGTDEKKQKQYEKIVRSIDRITHQVDNVLDFVKEKPVKMSKTKLSVIINESINSIIIPDDITLILPKTDIELLCDIHQISVSLNNLILNAIQAIDGTGTIEITCKENGTEIIIQVKDSGTGISNDDLSRVFEPLFTTKQKGTGLGLAGVKSIIESHGGIISVTSPPTIFTITLPKPKD